MIYKNNYNYYKIYLFFSIEEEFFTVPENIANDNLRKLAEEIVKNQFNPIKDQSHNVNEVIYGYVFIRLK